MIGEFIDPDKREMVVEVLRRVADAQGFGTLSLAKAAMLDKSVIFHMFHCDDPVRVDDVEWVCAALAIDAGDVLAGAVGRRAVMDDEIDATEEPRNNAVELLEDTAAQMRAVILVGCAVLEHDTDTPQSAFIELLLPVIERWELAVELTMPLLNGREQ